MVQIIKKFLFILLLCGLGSVQAQGSFLGQIKGLTNNWKVLVYMQADNDLAPYAYWDLLEMENAGIQDIPVLVELDLPGTEGIKRLKIVPRKVEVPNLSEIDFNSYSLSQLNSNVIKEFGEVEFSQHQRLMNFLIEAEEQYPTEHTLLVIWGHGEGFGGKVNAQFGGVALDDNPKDKLTLEMIKDSLNTYQVIFNKTIDILAMDACLMQTLEVAIELKGLAKYLVGSTQIQDFRGLPYDLLLKYMGSQLAFDVIESDNEPFELAKKIPFLFETKAKAEFDNDKRTMSVLNLEEASAQLVPRLNTVATNILNYIEIDPFYKLDILDSLQDLPFFLGESRDLSTLLSHLEGFFFERKELVIVESIQLARKSIQKSVLSYYYGNSYIEEQRIDLGAFKAFGVWFPGSIESYEKRSSEFQKSAFFQAAPKWGELFSQLYSSELF